MTDAGSPHGPDVREQRLVFGEDARLDEKACADYPESLVDGVLSSVGVGANCRRHDARVWRGFLAPRGRRGRHDGSRRLSTQRANHSVIGTASSSHS